MTRTPAELLRAFNQPVKAAIKQLRGRSTLAGDTADKLACELDSLLAEVYDTLKVQDTVLRVNKIKEAEAEAQRLWDERWKK